MVQLVTNSTCQATLVAKQKSEVNRPYLHIWKKLSKIFQKTEFIGAVRLNAFSCRHHLGTGRKNGQITEVKS